jgi:hypothetical protein
MTQLTLVKEKGNLRIGGFTSDQISNLLATKHSQDVFVPECKNGETWGVRDLLRLDAWVLLRTYSPLTTIGYEIKVSRQDFEQDQKWVGYLGLCHMFYFVCPAGMIRSIDLPEQIGLIWVSQSGQLHTKKKAERQQPDIEKQNRLLTYVVMARAKIVANMYAVNDPLQKPRLQQLREVVDHAKEKKELAYYIKGHIREMADQLSKKEREIIGREDAINDFQRRLSNLGIEWDCASNSWQDRNRVGSEIDLIKERIDFRTLENIKHAGKLLTELGQVIENYRGKTL